MSDLNKLSFKEKLGYGLGDGAANIAWRGVATFLFIFYTDVFGLSPVTVGVLFLVARFSDGISDVIMGVVGDRSRDQIRIGHNHICTVKGLYTGGADGDFFDNPHIATHFNPIADTNGPFDQ